MNINSEVSKQLDLTFPEQPQQSSSLSEIESKVENYVNDLLVKGCQWWESAARKASTARNIYRAAWIPYYMLKSPFAYRKKLHDSSAEKNLQILSEATAANMFQSVVTPGIYRRVPWISLSAESSWKISQFLSGTSLLYPFVYSPAYSTLSCVRFDKDSTGLNTLDIKQILNDLGRCLNKNSEVYQKGPETLVAIASSLALGALFGTVSYTLSRLLLRDGEGKNRYKQLNTLYTDVAMLLKSRWDEAVKNDDKEAIKECVAQATKLSTNSELIIKNLKSEASLTDAQTNDIKLKLSWGFNYVINQDKLRTQELEKKLV